MIDAGIPTQCPQVLVREIMFSRGRPGVGLEVGRRVGSAAAELPSWPPRKADGPVLPEKTGALKGVAAPALKSGMGVGASVLRGAACMVARRG